MPDRFDNLRQSIDKLSMLVDDVELDLIKNRMIIARSGMIFMTLIPFFVFLSGLLVFRLETLGVFYLYYWFFFTVFGLYLSIRVFFHFYPLYLKAKEDYYLACLGG